MYQYEEITNITDATILAELTGKYFGNHDRTMYGEDIDEIISSDMHLWVPALFDLEGKRVETARIIEVQGFAYPYNYEERWLVPAPDGGKATFLPLFPKRRTTHSKKGFVQGAVQHRVSVDIQVQVGRCVVSIHRHEIVAECPDIWVEEKQ